MKSEIGLNTNNKRTIMTTEQIKIDMERQGVKYRCGDLKDLVNDVIESLNNKERKIALAERYEVDYSYLLGEKLSYTLSVDDKFEIILDKYKDVIVEEVRLYSDDDCLATEVAAMAINTVDTDEELRFRTIISLAQQYGFFLL